VLEIENTYARLNDINLKILQASVAERDFFLYGTHDKKFYETGKSEYLILHGTLFDEVQELLSKTERDEISDEETSKHLLKTHDEIEEMEKKFAAVVALYRKRGFENYGLEGKLRESIHFIEEHISEIDLNLVLFIRRHEKDFFLRKEIKYADLLNRKLNALRFAIIKKKNNPAEQNELLGYLEDYRKAFNDIVEIEQKIGLLSEKGLKNDLEELSSSINKHIADLDKIILHRTEILSQSLHFTFAFVFLLVIAANIGIVLFVVKKLGKPIEDLSKSIHHVIERDFDLNAKITEIDTNDEIGLLSKDFAYMVSKVQKNMREIKEANEDLLQKNEEINQQNEEIHAIAENLRVVNEEVEKKNKDILASINYAKRIQNAILPRSESIQNVFPEHFVFFQPRDVVSGDFYWFHSEGSKSILAAIDCTGHGVPGAIMSVIADALLREAVFGKNYWSPDDILTEMNKQITLILKPQETRIRDGMDVSVCVFDKENALLEFSGAKSPLYYLQYSESKAAGQVEIIKGSIHPIGGNFTKYVPHFPKHKINLRSENSGEKLYTMFYIFSDGYEDQFGGKEGRKFLSKRFRDLLYDIHLMPVKKQHGILAGTIDEWMSARGERQLDDLLIIGVRVVF
jgi:serine phosphatase RsbU (regulator of sigma subunit)